MFFTENVFFFAFLIFLTSYINDGLSLALEKQLKILLNLFSLSVVYIFLKELINTPPDFSMYSINEGLNFA